MPVNDPPEEGKNRTVTVLDCPADRLNVLPPLSIEKPDPVIFTFPVSVPVVVEVLLIVIVCSDDCPGVTVPKFSEPGTTEIPTFTRLCPVPLSGTEIGLDVFVALCEISNVPE